MKVTIPTKHFLGMKAQGDGQVPLGFVTPWTTLKTDPTKADSACKKRTNTVKNWAHGYARNNESKLKTHIIDNLPMSGFKVSQSFKRGGRWGAASAVWRIEDPRGFELEIGNGNMVEIMLCTTVVEGEIYAPCVWGRCGQENILIPTDSAEYKEAQQNTKLVTESVSIRDVKIGNRILLQSGKQGIYMGSWHCLAYENNSYYYEEKDCGVLWTKAKKHLVILDNYSPYSVNDNQSAMLASNTLKISKILEDDTLGLTDAQKTINSQLSKNKLVAISGNDDTLKIITVATAKEDISIETEEIDEIDVSKSSVNDNRAMIVTNGTDTGWGSIANYYRDVYTRGDRYSFRREVIDGVFATYAFDLDLFLEYGKLKIDIDLGQTPYSERRERKTINFNKKSNNRFYIVHTLCTDKKTGQAFKGTVRT